MSAIRQKDPSICYCGYSKKKFQSPESNVMKIFSVEKLMSSSLFSAEEKKSPSCLNFRLGQWHPQISNKSFIKLTSYAFMVFFCLIILIHRNHIWIQCETKCGRGKEIERERKETLYVWLCWIAQWPGQ